jgi:1-acyl-sn-glycerol-3-phosphate acyltransferase
MDSIEAGALVWNPPVWREILTWPLPYQDRGNRLLLRASVLFARGNVCAVYGLEHLRPALDPFILAANHSSRREALLVPPLMMLHRGGRIIHFLADWNFRLIPGVGFLYKRAGTISVARKSARPRILNRLKPLFVDNVPALEKARQYLVEGRSVGIFPEGTVNRDPTRLLPGRSGAARLSLETGVSVVPMGIRFPEDKTGYSGPMEIHIGAPLYPPAIESLPAPLSDVRLWHAQLMNEIARLSGKIWSARMGKSS